ncbi:MAG: transposase [Porticoccaceae bacterium]|nr:transposase [Porticoccaceae bacterium]
MSRPLRIELAGGLYHVTSRGDRREDIYVDDADRIKWLALFGEVCERFNWRCHAYCLMSNHYHIVVETAEGNLSKGMRQLNGVYTQYSNRTYNRVGHVFQGRYKAILVEQDSHLLELARYVVLNPLRARTVRKIGKWPWSSYPAMMGDVPVPSWLETDWLLAQFSRQKKRARAKYTDFVREGLGLPPVWGDLKQQIYLGDDEFVEQMKKHLNDTLKLKEVPRAQRRPPANPLAYYQANHQTSKAAMVAAYATGDYTLNDIADHFDVHYSTVSRAVKKAEE